MENNIWAIGGPNWERDSEIIRQSDQEYLKEKLDYIGGLVNNPIQAVAAYA